MSELPKGWVSVCLNDVVDKIVGGGTPSKSKPSYYTGEIPWMTVKDMNKLYLTDTIDHITQEAVDNSSTNVIPAGTPIIATRMSLGKIVRANFDSAINQDLKAIFVNSSINKFYFEYWYRSKSMLIESLGTGTTVKGVRLEVLKDLKFPLSSLNEQKRIVEKLDEVLAQVDTIKARLDGIPAILKRFRQSVLAAAVSGKLTEKWRESNQHPEWILKKLKDITFSISDGDHQAPPRADSGIPFLVISNVSSGCIDFEGVTRWVPQEYFDGLKDVRIPKHGDLLYTVTGSFGIPVKVNTEDKFCFQRHIAILKSDSSIVDRDYLFYWLSSPIAMNQAQETATGTAQKTVSLTSLRNFQCSLPFVDEQKEIVRLVEQYFAFADTIEAQVKKAQARVDNLTQSILAKAFRGELVPQDPNDEPADKLLERIAAARKEADALAKAAKKAAPKK